MKALVTGGGGFLGLAVVRKLVERGTSVRTFSRHEHPELRSLGVQQHQGDLADADAVSAAVCGCDVVFHTAAKAGIWGPLADYHRTNVTGTENVIVACRKHRVPRLVYTSSPSVVFNGSDMEGVDESVPYPDHFDAAYPATKAAAEKLVRAANDSTLATVALRPHLIWGPGDPHLLPRLEARARAGQLRRIGRKTNLVDTVFIDNAAAAHLLAADCLSPGCPLGGRAYFITQGEPLPLWEMVNRLLDAAGAPRVQRQIPVWLALVLAAGFAAVHQALHRPGEPRLTRFVVKELSTAHWFDLSAARRDLGYRPAITTAEGLVRLAAYCRNSPRSAA